MKAHILQHVPFENIGSIASWLEARQATATYTRFFEHYVLPELKALDLIVVLGGPMSVNDESTLPWLRTEKEFVRDAVRRGIPMVGICLGAQLIASALGERVYRNACREIGWFPVMATSPAENSFRFPKKCRVFHWHGETFDLPTGAVLLARSEGTENQAFQIGGHVVGLQFHLETTPESVRALIDNCRSELVPGQYIQTEDNLLQTAAATYAKVNSIMSELLSYITG